MARYFYLCPPKVATKKVFLGLSEIISGRNEFPWLCVGNFNEVGSIWEKQEGEVCSRSRIEQFQQVISDCSLMDLEFKGPAYTWSIIKEKDVILGSVLTKSLPR